MGITKGMFTSNTPEWATPQALYNALDKEFNFMLDPCATDENHKAPIYYTAKEDGLKQDWGTMTAFINPPYGRGIGQWVKKAYEHANRGGVAVALLPCRTCTKWWDYVMLATEIRFIKDRLKFNDGDIGAPFPSCIVIWGTPRQPVIKQVNQVGVLI